MRSYDLDGYITGRLNSQEQALYDANKAKVLLCMGDGVFATNYSEQYYISSTLHNGNGDAFRHTIWNYGMVIDVGYDFAKQFSDAHEYGTPNNPAIERTMDLYNNGVGLRLGQANPGTILHSTFISKSMARVDDTFCRIIKNNVLGWSDSTGKK